jgi:hypothetical protein
VSRRPRDNTCDRQTGRRAEAEEYAVNDGDVLHFLFNMWGTWRIHQIGNARPTDRLRLHEVSGRTAVPAFEALHVFNIRLTTDGQACSLKSAYAELHSIDGHDLDSMGAQVINQP